MNICSNHRGGTSVMYHSKLCYISYVPQFEPLILGVKMLHKLIKLPVVATRQSASVTKVSVQEHSNAFKRRLYV